MNFLTYLLGIIIISSRQVNGIKLNNKLNGSLSFTSSQARIFHISELTLQEAQDYAHQKYISDPDPSGFSFSSFVPKQTPRFKSLIPPQNKNDSLLNRYSGPITEAITAVKIVSDAPKDMQLNNVQVQNGNVSPVKSNINIQPKGNSYVIQAPNGKIYSVSEVDKTTTEHRLHQIPNEESNTAVTNKENVQSATESAEEGDDFKPNAYIKEAFQDLKKKQIDPSSVPYVPLSNGVEVYMGYPRRKVEYTRDGGWWLGVSDAEYFKNKKMRPYPIVRSINNAEKFNDYLTRRTQGSTLYQDENGYVVQNDQRDDSSNDNDDGKDIHRFSSIKNTSDQNSEPNVLAMFNGREKYLDRRICCSGSATFCCGPYSPPWNPNRTGPQPSLNSKPGIHPAIIADLTPAQLGVSGIDLTIPESMNSNPEVIKDTKKVLRKASQIHNNAQDLLS